MGLVDGFKSAAHTGLDAAKNATQKGLEAAKDAQAAHQDHQQAKADELTARGVLIQLKSLEGNVTLFEDRIEIANLLGSKHRVIPYSQIHAVNLDKVSSLAKGAAAFVTAGASLAVTNKKRLTINAGIETVGLEFRVESLDRIKQAMAIINERIGNRSQSNVTVNVTAPEARPAGPDFADDLIKLAQLRDSGVITQEDFDKKKAQILGL
jgi:hypothetical protein